MFARALCVLLMILTGLIVGVSRTAVLAAGTAPSSAGPLALTQPICTMYTDPTSEPPNATAAQEDSDGSASPPGGSTGELESLDLVAGGMATVSGNLDVQMQVQSLDSGTMGWPDTKDPYLDNWMVQWDFGGTTYYLRAQYVGGGPPSAATVLYTYGSIMPTPTGTTRVPMGNATGSMDTTNGLINFSVPLSNVGSPANGTQLTGVDFQTWVQAGVPLYAADSSAKMVGALTYTVGKAAPSCGTTASRITRFTSVRRGAVVSLRWHVSRSEDVAGFNIYAGNQRLNTRVIPAHRSLRYQYRAQWSGTSRLRLQVLLVDGQRLTYKA